MITNQGGKFIADSVVFVPTEPIVIIGITVATKTNAYVEILRSDDVIIGIFDLVANEERSTISKIVIRANEEISIKTDNEVSLTISLWGESDASI